MDFSLRHVTVPFRMQPGLSRLAEGECHWSRLDPASALFAEKCAVLERDIDGALLASEAAAPGLALDNVASVASAEHPGWLMWDGQTLDLPSLGITLQACGAHWQRRESAHAVTDRVAPLLAREMPAWQRMAAALALVLHEDWAVLRAQGMVDVIAACTPSRWSPAEKVGRDFRAIHAPVADNRLIVGAADALTRLVTAGERWERHVWTLTPWGGYDQHPQRTPVPDWPSHEEGDALLASTWLRVERQTFQPIAGHGACVFTIRVERAPVSEALQEPALLERVADAIASMSPDVLAYRHLDGVHERLVAALRTRARQPR